MTTEILLEPVTEPDTRVSHALRCLKRQRIETASWAFVSSGTRFKVFTVPGTARDVFEKVDDAALVHRLTGVAPTFAINIPWDRVEGDDYARLARYAKDNGIAIGSVNPNLSQDEDYRLGSVTNPDPRVRRKAVDHLLECVSVMREVDSRVLSLWFPDGTNYPGQDGFRRRRGLMLEALVEVYDALGDDQQMLVEYKFYEPALYHTVLCDWGQALLMCQSLGEKSKVLVDLGHHAQAVNIEHIVATLSGEGRLGGFDLNSRKYGDDDLIVGAVNPHELFLIFCELVSAGEGDDVPVPRPIDDVLLKLDQCHMVEEKVPAILQSVVNVQTAYAKALLVDRQALDAAQRSGDVTGALAVLTDAWETDVRPLLAQVRDELGASSDPVAEYRASGGQEARIVTRVGRAASW